MAAALITGDYVTPSSGPRAGQLGAWSRIVSAAGGEPRGTFMKCFHVGLGLAWLIALILFAMRPANGWWIVLACSIGTLWYLPIGTIASAIVIVLLLMLRSSS